MFKSSGFGYLEVGKRLKRSFPQKLKEYNDRIKMVDLVTISEI